MAARPYFLRTPRLGFGVWSPEDLPLALALWGDVLVTRYIGGPFSAEAVRQRLDAEIGLMARDGVQYWPIFLLDGDEEVRAFILSHGADVRVVSPAWLAERVAREAAAIAAHYPQQRIGPKRAGAV